MHRLLTTQLARVQTADGTAQIDRLLQLVERTYAQFDTDRSRLERSTKLMIAELEEINRQREVALTTLSSEHHKLDVALQNMAHGLAMYDPNGALVLSNDRFSDLFGNALAGASELNDRATFSALVTGRARARGGEATQSQITMTDGRIVNCAFQPLSDGGWVEIYSDVTAQTRADERIKYLARHDPLTGLANRTVFGEALAAACSRVKRGAAIAVLYLDLDHFKSVNDSLGHPIGDKLLVCVAQRLSSIVRETDVLARLGGDEFAIIQVDADQPVSAGQMAKRVIEALTTQFDLDGHLVSIGTSVGIAIGPNDGTEADVLMRNADMALYRSKSDGRRVYRYFEAGMDEAMQARRTLEQDLRRAIVCNEFELYYQPLVDSKCRSIRSFEALIRWNHPTRGRVSPDNFIPLAEEIGLIVDIGEWVLREACRFARDLPDDVGIAVNVSPAQFRSAGLAQTVASAIEESGIAARRLEIEITETVLLQDTDRTLRILHDLKSLGVRIAMDDFGTGYSSLSFLRKFPFDKLKIDRTFVGDLGVSSGSGAIVRAVTELATSLGMRTTAEGVETAEQMALLGALNCTELQGYLFSRPLPASDIPALLGSFRPREIAA